MVLLKKDTEMQSNSCVNPVQAAATKSKGEISWVWQVPQAGVRHRLVPSNRNNDFSFARRDDCVSDGWGWAMDQRGRKRLGTGKLFWSPSFGWATYFKSRSSTWVFQECPLNILSEKDSTWTNGLVKCITRLITVGIQSLMLIDAPPFWEFAVSPADECSV